MSAVTVAAAPSTPVTPVAPSLAPPAPAGPKAGSPMNINPNKTPVLTPPAPHVGPARLRPSIAKQLAQAQAMVAKDPGPTLICLMPDGSVAGVILLDKVHPTDPISNPDGLCTLSRPGSKPL